MKQVGLNTVHSFANQVPKTAVEKNIKSVLSGIGSLYLIDQKLCALLVFMKSIAIYRVNISKQSNMKKVVIIIILTS